MTTGPRSGLQMFQEHLAAGGGPRQPIETLLGIRPVDVSPGRAVMELTASPNHHNGAGILHGGTYATVLDNACAAACYTTVTAGTRIVTTDLTVKFLRSATGESGVLTCEAEVVNRGRRNVLVQASMMDGAGRLLAHATCTIMIVD
ncbi:PaaI family thioesterase [Streptomyces wedmorensis]|uniref:PaaI family thioesterase n=1 Tax=Streptomyces wedmorensis TaxID=43759 RepID=A0ABW6J5C1_STRWE